MGSGVALRLMETFIEGARAAGVRHLCGDVLDANAPMPACMRKHGPAARFEDRRSAV